MGHLDDQGRLCLPRSKTGVCKATVVDSTLCELPSCQLTLSSAKQPPTECCFTPRFRSPTHACIVAEGACAATIAGTPTMSRLDPKETERVQKSVPHACCYTEDGDM